MVRPHVWLEAIFSSQPGVNKYPVQNQQYCHSFKIISLNVGFIPKWREYLGSQLSTAYLTFTGNLLAYGNSLSTEHRDQNVFKTLGEDATDVRLHCCICRIKCYSSED